MTPRFSTRTCEPIPERWSILNKTEILRLVKAACDEDHLRFAQQIRLLADSYEQEKPSASVDRLRRLAELEQAKGQSSNPNLTPVDGLTEPLPVLDGTHEPVWDKTVEETLDGLVEEHRHSDVLVSHNLTPRNKIILTGAPGTGKTTFASILAERLGLPGIVLRADRVINSQLGKTLNNIALVFDRLHAERRLLFIDECDMLLARRDNVQDVAEMRRATNFMLQKIDSLPDDCVLVCATNMTSLIDRAAWRRFDVRIRLNMTDKPASRIIVVRRLKELNVKSDVPADFDMSGVSPSLLVQTVDGLARNALISGSETIPTETLLKAFDSLKKEIPNL